MEGWDNLSTLDMAGTGLWIVITLCFIFLTVRTIVLERIFIKKRNSIKIGNIYNNVYADSEGFYQVEVLDINNPKRFISFRKVGEEQVYLLFERDFVKNYM